MEHIFLPDLSTPSPPPPHLLDHAPTLLLVAAVFSALIVLNSVRPFSRSSRGPIALPTTTSDTNSTPEPINGASLLALALVPNSDIEFIDSTPFYVRLRIRKLWTLATLVVCLGIDLFRLGWTLSLSLADGDAGGGAGVGVSLGDGVMMGAFWTVTIVYAILSLPLTNDKRDIHYHWTYTVTLCSLTLAVLSVTLLRLILPTSTSLPLPPHENPTDSQFRISLALTVASTTFQFLAFYLSGTTDRCAPLGTYFSPSSLLATSTSTDSDDSTSTTEEKGPEKTLRPISAVSSCSPISFILFSWISPVLHVGSNLESLQEDDLPMLGSNDRAENLWIKIRDTDASGCPGWMNKLLWRCVKVNRRLFYWQSALALITSFLYYLPAFFLQKFILFLENKPKTGGSLAWGYAFCVGLLVAALLDAVVSGQLWFVSNSMLATRLRTGLNCAVFDKTLKRKDVAGVSASNKPEGSTESGAVTPAGGEGKDKATTGSGLFDFGTQDETFASRSAVLNLFTIDVDRVADFAVWSFSLIDAPAEIAIGTFFLYQLLGYAAFVGIGVAVLFLPLNHWTSKAFANVQDKLMSARDRRVSLMNEVLQSIRMIKFFAFEAPFEERILVARDDELKQLKHNFLLEVSFNAIWSASPILCVLVSFYVYTKVMGEELTPSTAFASLAVWNELRFALNIIPDILVQAIQCLVSLRRIEKYLNLDEISSIPLIDSPSSPDEDEEHVAFRSATVTWPSAAPSGSASRDQKDLVTQGQATPKNSFQLQDLSIDFPEGKMSLVCGSLGAGKTLLLLALLGEADVLAGQVVCPRSPPDAITLPNIEWDKLLNNDNWVQSNRTAFVPQQAWLQNASIRNNILFGLPFRQDRYKATLEACSLVSDFEILEDGDATEIGEKGINLSGGQKARVSLARAVYSRASLLLLDDVLSAVDAHTAQHIFNACLRGPLMKRRTIVLVSHNVQLCAPGVDYVVALENGRSIFTGSSTEFLASERFKVPDEEEDPLETLATLAKEKDAPKARNKALDLVASTAASSVEVSSASEAESESDEDSDDEDDKPKVVRKLIEDETRAVGRVNLDVWKLYLGLSGGTAFWILFAVSFGGTKVADVAQTFWLNVWAGSYEVEGAGSGGRSVSYYLSIYALLSFVGVFVGTLQWFVLYLGSLRASDRIHRLLLRSILRAPLRFFDTQALGRLLNRFGKDMEGVDSQLPDTWGRTLMYGLGVLTTLSVVASVAPAFLLGFFVLSIAYLHYAKLFSKTARELRRLDSVSKSPLYSIYGETVSGVAVIRAFGSSQRFMTLMLERCGTNVTFYWYLWSVNRWLSIRFACLSAIVLALTGYALLAAGDKIDAALAGFALTFALNLANDILFLVRRYTALELAMVGVERIKEYAEVEQEAPEIVEPRPSANWPTKGEVKVENLCISYAPELPDVLHELNFYIAPGEKVGCVGATGCGKSTLALSFFRFVEARTGRIVIDGIDISSVGLKDLRSNLTIIPQDPTILSGTLRSTLDIFSEYTDIEIFDALRRVHLIKAEDEVDIGDGANRSPFYNLDGEVAEGGGNFSQGQRQLLCMARALLKRNKMLILDEATASVDAATDEMISGTIRSQFSDSTLLVIAHRLRTIIDFDKVLVLDAGRIIEYNSPATLIKDPASRFHALCRASGKNEFRILKKMAEGKARVTYKPRKLVRRTSTFPKPSSSNVAKE